MTWIRTIGEDRALGAAARTAERERRRLVLLRTVVGVVAASAFVAIWGGWVGLGSLAGFGRVNLLPGMPQPLYVDLAITLPLGIEAYAAVALYVAVGGLVRGAARVFAWCSAVGALTVGAAGQAIYHVLAAQDSGSDAPTVVVVGVSVLPVVVLGMASVLLHLAEEHAAAAVHDDDPVQAVPADGEAEDCTDPAHDGTEQPTPEPWVDFDHGATEFFAALDAPRAATVQPVQAVPAEPVQGSGTRLQARPADPVDGDRERGRSAVRAVLAHGRDMPVQELLQRLSAVHGMSERWWRYRLDEVRQGEPV